jgi:plastocyanin
MKHLYLALALLAPAMAGAATPPPAVRMVDDAFSPATLTVDAGTTVVFTNRDDDAHTVTAVDGTFDSKGLDSGASWSHTFTKPGTYRYFCELHPFMKGTIVVKAVRA